MTECPYCSNESTKIFHQGKCPLVKSIEYFPNGIIKKIEFFSDVIEVVPKTLKDEKSFNY